MSELVHRDLVRVVVDGCIHTGTYQIEGGSVVVRFGRRRKSAPLNSVSAQALAERLLLQIVTDKNARIAKRTRN